MDCFVGEIRMFAGNYVPQDWAGCDGAVLQISQNEILFSLIGVTYGGDGISTFALPDLRGRIPVGQGQGTGLTNRVMGQKFGDAQVSLTEANLPAHSHAIAADGDSAATTSCDAAGHLWGRSTGTNPVNAYTDGAALPAPAALATMAQGLAPCGSSGAHENRQPFAVVTMIIAMRGLYPTRSN